MADTMSEDEANALLDRLFTEKFGRTFREPPSTPEAKPPDSFARIRADFPVLFDSPAPGPA